MLVNYGFPDSKAINQAHSLAKLHTAVLETHSPADGAQSDNVLNCKIKVLFKITISWRMDHSIALKQDVLW